MGKKISWKNKEDGVNMTFGVDNPGLEGDFTVRTLEDVTPVNGREKLSFHQAARHGNAAVIQKYLTKFHGKRRKINKLDKLELSALHYAVRHGHLEVVKLLLEAKANVNKRGADGALSIHFAAKYFKATKHIDASVDHVRNVQPIIEAEENFVLAENGNGVGLKTLPSVVENAALGSDVISYLLEHGADINAVDNYNQTPLHYAAIKGNVEATSILLNWPGARLNLEICDTSGGTALHTACGNGNTDVAKMLLLSGAQLMVWDNEHMNPLHYAATGDGAQILREIIVDIEKQNGQIGTWFLKDIINDRDNQGQSLLHLAVDTGHYETCCLVIEKGANVNSCRDGFSTALHLAATTGDVNIVKLLVASGADYEAQNIVLETPLHRAACYNRAEVVQFLLEKGCSVNACNQDNETPLMVAAANGKVETLQILLQHNADLCILDSGEKSVIFWAAEENAVDVLRILLEHSKGQYIDADLINQQDRFENTPLHIAAKKGYKNIVNLLLEYNAEVDLCNDEELTPLHIAAINGNKKVAMSLLNKKPSIINDEDESGNSALHLAALNGHPKLIDLMIDYGASVDPRNCFLWTPLDCAAVKGHVSTVIALLERDSPIDPIDLASTTPLHLAAREGHDEVVKVLLDGGADVTLLDHSGRNAFDMAVENSHRSVTLELLNHPDWLSILKNRSREGKSITTPMRQLIKKLPDVAHLVLNKCMKLTSHLPPDSFDFKVQFYYDLLDDTYADWSNDYEDDDQKSMVTTTTTTPLTNMSDLNKLTPDVMKILEAKKNHPLNMMCEYKCGNLLNHPLVLSLIYEKWQRFGRVVFYSKFSLYFIFLFFLTGYVLVSRPLFPKKIRGANNTTCVPSATSKDKDDALVIAFVIVGRFFVIGLGCLQLFLELLQLIARRWDYVKDLTNWVEWAIYTLAIIFTLDDIDHYITTTSCSSFHVSIGSVAIFLAWIDLLLFIQKFPTLGIYVVMFTDVLKTFMKFSLTFALFIVAFGLGFFTLLGNLKSYSNFARGIMKTTVMMIGEFDFDALFNSDDNDPPPMITWFLFFIFVIIMTILLMNLMVGLAVDDIKGVLDQAVLNRVAMQVHLVLDVEKTLPYYFRRRFIMKEKFIYPNRDYQWLSLHTHVTTMNDIHEAMNPTKSVSDIVQEHTQSIRESVDKLKTNFKDMSKQMKNVEQMLETILKASNITNDTDDC